MTRPPTPSPMGAVLPLRRPGSPDDRKPMSSPFIQTNSPPPREHALCDLHLHRVAALTTQPPAERNDAEPDGELNAVRWDNPMFVAGWEDGERAGYRHGWWWGVACGAIAVGLAAAGLWLATR